MERFINIKLSFRSFVTVIGVQTSEHVTLQKEVHVTQSTKRHLQIVFSTDNIYWIGRPRYKTLMIKAGIAKRNGQKCNKIWFSKTLG